MTYMSGGALNSTHLLTFAAQPGGFRNRVAGKLPGKLLGRGLKTETDSRSWQYRPIPL